MCRNYKKHHKIYNIIITGKYITGKDIVGVIKCCNTYAYFNFININNIKTIVTLPEVGKSMH